jgi:ribosomal protein L22
MADDKTPVEGEAKAPRAGRTAAKPKVAAAKSARSAAGAKQADETKRPARARAAAKSDDDAGAAKPARRRSTAQKAATKPARASSKQEGEERSTPAEVATPVAQAPKRPAARRAAQEVAAAPTPAPTSAPARRRRPAPPGPVTVSARARYVRSSARKARLVCDHIRGKSVPEAKALLAFAPRGVARDWAKLLDSAIANAENNHELIADELRVTAVYADEGPTIKRFKPRAMGRATPILKRTSHLTIELGTKEH